MQPDMNDPRLPKFIVIGVMKCGTGATQHFLHNHPDLAQAKGRFQNTFFLFYLTGLSSFFLIFKNGLGSAEVLMIRIKFWKPN